MKKGVGILLVSFMLVIFIANFVIAQAEYNYYDTNIFVNGGSAFENLKNKIPSQSPILRYGAAVAGVYILGVYDIEAIGQNYSLASVIILFLMVWLILFVGFSDILHYFSQFSPWVSWVIGFAMAIIAANVGFIQLIVYWGVVALAVLGTIAIFVAIGFAFVAFICLNWGMGWVLDRKAAMEAHRGRTDIAQGIQTFASAGRAARGAGRGRGIIHPGGEGI